MMRYTSILAILCTSTLIHSAATKADDRLTLLNCFDLQRALAPGKQRYYVPFAFITTDDSSFVTNFFFGITHTLYGIVGIIEGDNESVTHAVAQEFIPSLETGTGELHLRSQFYAAQRKVLQTNAAHTAALLNMKFIAYPVTSSYSRNSMLHDTSLKLVTKYGNIDSDPYIICSAKLKTTSDKIGRIVGYKVPADSPQDDISTAYKIAAVATYAATQPETHEALYLMLNKERYALFIAQEFDQPTDECTTSL